MKAFEFAQRLREDGDLAEAQATKKEASNERKVRVAREEAALISQLNALGFGVKSLAGLSGVADYSEAYPILLNYIKGSNSPLVRYGAAMAMGRESALGYWPELIAALRAESDSLVRNGLANALVKIAGSAQVPSLLELVRDARIGDQRLVLLIGLAKSTSGRHVLADLSTDADLGDEARRLLDGSSPD